MRTTLIWAMTGMMALGACSTTPPDDVIVERPGLPAVDPVQTGPLHSAGSAGSTASDTVVVTGDSGLVERLPNTCKLENYQHFMGQPASALDTAVLGRPHRIVAPDTIVTQEYNPARLNFNVDAQGTIRRISCG